MSLLHITLAPKDMPGCGADRPALLAEAEGTIESPSRAPSANYPDNSFCQWRVTVPEGKVLDTLYIFVFLVPENILQGENYTANSYLSLAIYPSGLYHKESL